MSKSWIAAGMLACATCVVGAGAHAVPVGFSNFTVFGDSLSDKGNLFAATGGLFPPSPPYYEGRLSNGPVWAEYIAEGFEARDLGNANYAYARAQALPADPSADLPIDIPDLPQQIGLFASDPNTDLGKRPLAAMLFGANDLFSDGIPNLDPVNVGIAASNAVADGALQLSTLGFQDFLILNLPDLGDTPSFNLFQPQARPLATAGTIAFNANLDQRIDELRASGLGVYEIDLYALFKDLLVDPEKYGVNDTILPCLFPTPEAAEAFGQPLLCQGEPQLGRAFFDQIHPNLVIHQQIADQVSLQIAPVPLPASALLLMAGLAGFAFVRRAA